MFNENHIHFYFEQIVDSDLEQKRENSLSTLFKHGIIYVLEKDGKVPMFPFLPHW